MYKNIWNDIILLNLKDFENIGINFYINIFFFIIAFLFCVIAVFLELNRDAMSVMAKQLLRHSAMSPSDAKRLCDLGLDKNKRIRFQLLHKTSLSRLVSRVGAPDITYEDYVKLPPQKRRELDKFDIESAEFYISDENVDRATKIYYTYRLSLPRLILFCLFILLFCALLTVFSYEIICSINVFLEK